MMAMVTIDSKGRILLPRAVRQSMQIEPGDALYLAQDGQIVSLAKAENPFDRLAAQAVAAYYAGDTVSLDDALDALRHHEDGKEEDPCA